MTVSRNIYKCFVVKQKEMASLLQRKNGNEVSMASSKIQGGAEQADTFQNSLQSEWWGLGCVITQQATEELMPF
jgi:hypothetical protein